ncbi:MAG: hypothetical protein J5I50_07495 [Chitinophagaceae bacterium]|nr:hypothetical protein [Chitinophagaceae bacterium]
MHHEEEIESSNNDVARSWVSTSRFLFYVQVAVVLALFVGMSYGLYTNRYKGKPKVEIPANTQFNPEYK